MLPSNYRVVPNKDKVPSNKTPSTPSLPSPSLHPPPSFTQSYELFLVSYKVTYIQTHLKTDDKWFIMNGQESFENFLLCFSFQEFYFYGYRTQGQCNFSCNYWRKKSLFILSPKGSACPHYRALCVCVYIQLKDIYGDTSLNIVIRQSSAWQNDRNNISLADEHRR